MFSLIIDQIKEFGTGNESSGNLVKCFLNLSDVRDTSEKSDKNDRSFPRTYRYSGTYGFAYVFFSFYYKFYLFIFE